MKKYFIILLTLTSTLFSCSPSKSDSGSDNEGSTEPGFAMTAKINGNEFQANNPFGTNEFSTNTIRSYYPREDYIVLQGRQGGGFGGSEIGT